MKSYNFTGIETNSGYIEQKEADNVFSGRYTKGKYCIYRPDCKKRVTKKQEYTSVNVHKYLHDL